MDIIYINTSNDLLELEAPQTDSIYHCEDTGIEYVYNPNTYNWDELTSLDEDFLTNEENTNNMTLYDVNKMLIKQLPPMSEEQIKDKCGKLLESFYNYKEKYYMLLCREYNYYTVFEKNNCVDQPFVYAVIDIIKDLGDIHTVNKNDDGVLEFWITPYGEDDVYAFFLFPYERGIVYFG